MKVTAGHGLLLYVCDMYNVYCMCDMYVDC